jgi:hypothetical protein
MGKLHPTVSRQPDRLPKPGLKNWAKKPPETLKTRPAASTLQGIFLCAYWRKQCTTTGGEAKMNLIKANFLKAVLTALIALIFIPAIANAAGARAAGVNDAVMKPIHQFVDNINSNNSAAAAEAFTTPATIIDEFPPYYWRSDKTLAEWGASYEADSAKKGMTEPNLVLQKPLHVNIDNGAAYVVIPTVINLKIKGLPSKEVGILTFTVEKHDKAWKISSMTWTAK